MEVLQQTDDDDDNDDEGGDGKEHNDHMHAYNIEYNMAKNYTKRASKLELEASPRSRSRDDDVLLLLLLYYTDVMCIVWLAYAIMCTMCTHTYLA